MNIAVCHLEELDRKKQDIPSETGIMIYAGVISQLREECKYTKMSTTTHVKLHLATTPVIA